MALAITGTLVLGDPQETDAHLPRICYRNHALEGQVTVSSEQLDHPADMAVDPFSATAWIGEEGANEWWIRVSKEGARADYASIAAWDLTGTTIRLQASDDGGSTWVDVAQPVMTADRVVVFLFDSAVHDDWRVYFDGDQPPQVVNLSIGEATVIAAGLRSGFEPPKQARNNEITNTVTDQGHLTGRSIVRKGIETQLDFRNVPEEWVRDVWEPFVDHAELRPFYVVWAPLRWPNEAAFVWASGRIRPPRYSDNSGWMDVSLNVQGFAR